MAALIFSFHMQYNEEDNGLLQSLLDRVKFPLVVLLDGLGHDAGSKSDWVSWIPRRLPSNMRFIVSVTSGTPEHNALKVRIHR